MLDIVNSTQYGITILKKAIGFSETGKTGENVEFSETDDITRYRVRDVCLDFAV